MNYTNWIEIEYTFILMENDLVFILDCEKKELMIETKSMNKNPESTHHTMVSLHKHVLIIAKGKYKKLEWEERKFEMNKINKIVLFDL